MKNTLENNKISVALTTYNGSKYVIELLDSIINQTLLPDEVVIFDDNSSDDTVLLIEKYIKEHNLCNWNLYKNKINAGWKINFRKAINACRGDIIFLADQDDIWKLFKT